MAIVLVVVLHATGNTVRIDEMGRRLDFGLHSLSRLSVPLFVMLSGWLLLRRPATGEPASAFFRHRLPRILWPLLAWSAFYVVWRMIRYDETAPALTWLVRLTENGIYYHLWFLYMLASLYAVTPFIRLVLKQKDRSYLRWMLGLWLAAVLLPPLHHLLHGSFWMFSRGYPVDFLGYFVLGGLLGGRTLSDRGRAVALAAFLAGWVATWSLSWFATAPDAVQSTRWHGELRPNLIVMSVAAFVLLQNIGTRLVASPSWVRKSTAQVARHALGIYALHPVFLELCSAGLLGPELDALTRAGGTGRLGLSMLIIAACTGISTLAARIPFLRPLFA